MSTLGDTKMHVGGGYHEYTGGCSVHPRDTMSTLGAYLQYTGKCSGHRRDTMSTPGA